MMIENADHFGLAQLHQLRGRVGRGDAQSYCIMINTSNTKIAKKRLEILNNSNDGFYIASEDLKLRGPGDFFGIRQSGDLAFQLADIYQDADVLKRASEAVKEVLEADPELALDEHQGLRSEMRRFMDEQLKKMNL
jgi:ATP-dependent DNA helicase RecG